MRLSNDYAALALGVSAAYHKASSWLCPSSPHSDTPAVLLLPPPSCCAVLRGTGEVVHLEEEFRLLTLQVIGEAILSLPPEECDRVSLVLMIVLQSPSAVQLNPLIDHSTSDHGTVRPCAANVGPSAAVCMQTIVGLLVLKTFFTRVSCSHPAPGFCLQASCVRTHVGGTSHLCAAGRPNCITRSIAQGCRYCCWSSKRYGWGSNSGRCARRSALFQLCISGSNLT